MEKTDIMKKEELLSIENLSIRFRQYESGGGRRAFQQTFLPVITGLNVTVHRGEIVAVVGASGSGKAFWLMRYSTCCRPTLFWTEASGTEEKKQENPTACRASLWCPKAWHGWIR